MLKKSIAGAALLILANQGFADESADKALDLLKKMATTLESASSMSVQGMATIDEIEPMDDFKLQKSFSIDLKFERSTGLYVVKSGAENQITYFDGKTLTVFNPKTKKYAKEAVVGDVDELIKSLDRLNIEAPLADLLQSNLFEVAKKNVQKARYIDVARIGSENCDHVAFRTPVADWQLWIAQGARSTICKSIITTRGAAQAPQYQVTFSGWNFNQDIDDNLFVANVPDGATLVPFEPGALDTSL